MVYLVLIWNVNSFKPFPSEYLHEEFWVIIEKNNLTLPENNPYFQNFVYERSTNIKWALHTVNKKLYLLNFPHQITLTITYIWEVHSYQENLIAEDNLKET